MRTQTILRMIAEGAYRKATMALLEQGDVLSGAECRTWAQELHPESEHPDRALVIGSTKSARLGEEEGSLWTATACPLT